MADAHDQRQEFSPPELRDLIWAAHSGEIDETRLARLDGLLRTSGTARRDYVRYTRLLSDLQAAASKLESSDVLVAVAESEDRVALPAQWLREFAPPPRARFVFSRSSGALLLAAIVTNILVVALMVVYLSPTFRRQVTGNQAPLDLANESVVPFASVSSVENAVWSLPRDLVFAGKPIDSGERTLLRGSIEIEFATGTSVVVQGPSVFDVRSANDLRLEQGRLRANVPRAAIGFTVDTPKAKVVDLGTEFGVEVAESGTTEVHVFRGVVEARGVAASEENPTVRLVANQAIRISGDDLPVQIAVRPGAFASAGKARGVSAAFDEDPLLTSGPRCMAYQTEANAQGNQAWQGELGLDFDLVAPMVLFRLGVFDHLGDGIGPTSELKVRLVARDNRGTRGDLQDDEGGETLADLVFSATDPGKLIGGYRWKPLDKPLRVEAGSYSILASGFNGENQDYSDGDYAYPTIVACDSNRGLILPLGTRHSVQNDLGFPKILAKSPLAFAAGSFEYAAARDAESGSAGRSAPKESAN